MNSKRDNGGPAFPTENQYGHVDGMTLRDYFASDAMKSILRNNQGIEAKENSVQKIAELSYEVADAMLKARQA